MRTLTLSQVKAVYAFANDNGIDARELVEKIVNEEKDFYIDEYRFIATDYQLEAIISDFEGDAWMLGAFNCDFIADNTSLAYDIVKALQDAEKFEAIGQHILDNEDLSAFLEEAASIDGYGHFFSGYDGNELDDLEELGYYAYRN